ncbi:hypothetical protein BDP55DRAFT_635348 [Colletotrichum godetiae]|uniref:Secreted protein n=1 Tax=Colletotrichum godetiae TaxID=1209918 RepID=A0AAJ0ADK5_9PEZI|nr:uncharacterized protein BDP55DRAFT_635348 [Colletotrichum godetiae]KAK1671922.1 hypothetical protein BDP55DRAFT_635348 [Colletotrichum godetiae]
MAPVPHCEIICSFLSCLSVFCTERPTDRPTAPGLNTRWDGLEWDGTGDMCSCTKCVCWYSNVSIMSIMSIASVLLSSRRHTRLAHLPPGRYLMADFLNPARAQLAYA